MTRGAISESTAETSEDRRRRPQLSRGAGRCARDAGYSCTAETSERSELNPTGSALALRCVNIWGLFLSQPDMFQLGPDT